VVKERPRVSRWTYSGVKSGERKDIQERLNLRPGREFSDYVQKTSEDIIKRYYKEKGYLLCEVDTQVQKDTVIKSAIRVNFDVKKGEKVRIYYPILEWTNEDVERFIKERGIKCAPVYYDKDGTFHVERRLGCIGCPLATDNGRGDFRKYPKLLRQYVRAATDYLAAHPSTRAAKEFHGDGAALVFRRLFFKNLEDYRNVVDGGLFPEMRVNPREYMEKYFGIDLTP
jgi:hypothetical protein